jgi:hypothetical protein
MTFRLFTVITIILTFQRQAASGQSLDVVCGPRCVRYVLDWYHVPSGSLFDLISELQGNQVESGSSMADIRSALEDRGVATAAIHWKPGVPIQSRNPVIVHFPPGRDSKSRSGHFVVWLPHSGRGRVRFWNGLNGTETINDNEFYAKMSGPILLTGRTREDVNQIVADIDWNVFLTSFLGAGVGAASAWCVFEITLAIKSGLFSGKCRNG